MSSITEEGSHGKQLPDPAFKLFGRTIPVCSDESASCQDVGQLTSHSDDEISVPDPSGSHGYDEEKRSKTPDSSPMAKEGPDNTALGKEAMKTTSARQSLPDDDAPRDKIVSSGKEELLKKPEKLIPCPRCESMDTKFCYFNNYNVNQPRHFCRNCQRYWTAGGNLRNVPVGAGRRKSKPAIPLDRPESAAVRDDSPENAKNLISCSAGGASPSTTMLTFSQETPVSVPRKPSASRRSDVLQGYKPDSTNLDLKVDSARSVCNQKGVDADTYDEQKPSEKTTKNPAYWQHLQPIQDSAVKVAGSNQASGSSDLGSIHEAEAMPPVVSSNSSFSYMPEQRRADAPTSTSVADSSFSYMPGPWTYAPNLAWGNLVAANAASIQGEQRNSSGESSPQQPIHPATQSLWATNADFVAQLQWASLMSHHEGLNSVAQPPWAGAMSNPCQWPFVQHPFWWNSAWAMPWAAAAIAATATPTPGNASFGKRPRDSVESDTDKSVPPLVPKTLRIDDLGAAAQSSIWTALGLQTKSDNVASTGIFSKFETKFKDDECLHALKSNPAAMEVSALFRESNLPL